MLPIFGVITVLATHNVVLDALGPVWSHAALNFGVAVGLFAIARLDGLGFPELGLGTSFMRRGLVSGLVIGAAITAVIGVLVAIPFSRGYFEDDQFIGVSVASALVEALLRIPFVTVAFEEFAFRGVLFAMLLRLTTVRRTILISGVLFGASHILPALDAVDRDADTALVQTLLGTVVFTTLAGSVSAILRLWTGSLIAPFLVHSIANSVGYVAGWSVVRWEF